MTNKSPTGYSGTPLSKKLGIKEGHLALLVDAPKGFRELLAPLPPNVTVRVASTSKEIRVDVLAEVLVWFVRDHSELVAKFAAVSRALDPDGGLWVAWPKKSSRVATDVTEDRIREVALARKLVDNKVCAIDATWSGLRCVVRLVDRPAKRRVAPEPHRRAR